MWLGSFSKDEGDGDGIENAYIKINSRFFRLWRIYSKWLKITNVIFFQFSFSRILGDLTKGRKRKKYSSCVLKSSTKRRITKFHAVVAQARQRNVLKCVLQVQNLFLLIKPVVFLTFPTPLPSSSSLLKLLGDIQLFVDTCSDFEIIANF